MYFKNPWGGFALSERQEDDGDSYDYEKGNFILRNIIIDKNNNKLKTKILEVNKSKYVSKISNFKIIEH